MKYAFQAVDQKGCIVRDVLRAEDEDQAREMLLAEGIFPKSLEPVDDETRVTWTSREWLRHRREEGGASESEDDFSLPGEGPRGPASMRRGERMIGGILGVRPTGEVVFRAKTGTADSVVLRPERVEEAKIVGFPVRWLRVYLVDGDLLEFPAGYMLSGGVFKAACRALRG